jgi:hypothetical protein
MPGEFSKLLLHTGVMLVYSALYSDQLELDVNTQTPSPSPIPVPALKRKHKPHAKVVTLSVQAPKQTKLVNGMRKSERRAIGTVQYQEGEEVSAGKREDMAISSSQFHLRERLPLDLVRIKTHSLRARARSFEELRVN